MTVTRHEPIGGQKERVKTMGDLPWFIKTAVVVAFLMYFSLGLLTLIALAKLVFS